MVKATTARDMTTTATGQVWLASQSAAAEIKTSVKPKAVGAYLPQLWFGRTPWLIVGRHTTGVFTEIKVADAGAQFADWENRHQTKLLKLVSLLTELREVARKHGGGNCIAIYERGFPPAISIFESSVPNELCQTTTWSASSGYLLCSVSDISFDYLTGIHTNY